MALSELQKLKRAIRRLHSINRNVNQAVRKGNQKLEQSGKKNVLPYDEK